MTKYMLNTRNEKSKKRITRGQVFLNKNKQKILYYGIRILLVLLALVAILTFALPYLSTVFDQNIHSNARNIIFREGYYDECLAKKPLGYEERLDELKRILASVRRDLLAAAHQLEQVNAEYEAVSKQLAERRNELKIVELEIEEGKLYKKELYDRNNVNVHLPFAIPQQQEVLRVSSIIDFRRSSLESIFDFSKCSIAGNFGLYIYDVFPTYSMYLARNYVELLRDFSEITNESDSACLKIAFVDSKTNISTHKFWNNGTNHVLFNLDRRALPIYSNAIIVSSVFEKNQYRDGVDFSLSLRVSEYKKNEWKDFAPLLPFKREYIVSFVGPLVSDYDYLKPAFEMLLASVAKSHDSAFIDYDCISSNISPKCINRSRIVDIYTRSMFVLIIPYLNEDSSSLMHERLLCALQTGAIPVILSLNVPLPFNDLVDWNLILYRLPLQRMPEIHFILRSFSPADIIEMRRRGRFVLQNYLHNTKVVIRSLIAALRERIGVPSDKEGIQGKSLFGDNYTAPRLVPPSPPQFEEEYLGPAEAPHNSPSYTHNFTSQHLYSYYIWNSYGYVEGRSLEFLPVESAFPSGFEYGDGHSLGFRPISPGSGVEFSIALGGNRLREQFTVIMLTYRREVVLTAALERLNNLPYLNKVIVIWNDDEFPIEHTWPRLHVPVLYIKSSKNSLNNRFIPYKQIETEAVLSIDDDIDLKQHEIIFAFRVWRERRTRIVGFPARYHARYGDELFYNSNHTCQYSMILTGAAFIHKTYFYAYTYGMPEVIREKVDELMNCEDIAMNYLVSHLTRQPPIKTTSKWTIRCPTCSEMLSQDISHFNERHDCIRFLNDVYGYNPLLFSQFRADSVLFKTRLPPNHQKCFKYV